MTEQHTQERESKKPREHWPEGVYVLCAKRFGAGNYKYTRIEGGTNVHYQEGDRLWLSEREADALGNQGRLLRPDSAAAGRLTRLLKDYTPQERERLVEADDLEARAEELTRRAGELRNNRAEGD